MLERVGITVDRPLSKLADKRVSPPSFFV